MSLIQILILGAVFLFALIDFLVTHLKPTTTPTPGGVMGTVIAFFIDVNAKLKSLVDSIFAEIESHWPEVIILGVIYFLLFGLSLPLIFVYVLIGYLAMRLVADIFKK